MQRIGLALALLSLGACGGSGGSGGNPNSPAVLTTETYSGTTTQTAPGSCGGDSHTVTAREGTFSVQLVSTNDPNGGLSMQVCQGIDNPATCTITQQRITVGQTLSGQRNGSPAQVVKALPWACVFGGTTTAAPVSYTLSVTYMK